MSTRLFIVGMKPITVQRKTVRKASALLSTQMGVSTNAVHYQGSYRLTYSTAP